MVIQVNGKENALPKHITTVSALLDYYELTKKVVIVELNKEIINKEIHPTTLLKDGDNVELVHFVGGG